MAPVESLHILKLQAMFFYRKQYYAKISIVDSGNFTN